MMASSVPKLAATKKNSKALEESTREHVLGHGEFAKELAELAKEIRKIAAKAPNEATIATNFELKLYGQMKRRLQVEFEPVKEQAIDTKRHVKKGRLDSRIGALVIEYKQKSQLDTPKGQSKANSQIKNYLEHLPDDFKRGAVGVLTDGWRIKFVSCNEDDSFTETAFEDLSGAHLLRIIRGVLSLEKKALTPDNLIAGFCLDGDPSPAKQLASALYNALQGHPTGRSNMLFREWKAIFRLAHEDQSKQKAIEERRTALAEALNISIGKGDNDTEYKVLYAIQTSYAIIVKAIAFKVLSSIRANETTEFAALAEGSTETLRSHLNRLESGAIFRQEGFGNLLEGDFFAWYCTSEQWDKHIGAAVKKVFTILAEYENHHMFDGGHVQDLFKDLYMAIIPDKVRHSMGEFYTPPWLAEQTILEALGPNPPKKWTALDPCCGSGTFITALIRLVLEETKALPSAARLRDVLSRVKGIDLNPLAALTTRINYFVNLSHLIGEDDEFDVPVYLGDASYVPTPKKIGEVQCLEYIINTEKGPLNLVLPKSAVADVALFSKTMTRLEAYIDSENEAAVGRELRGIVSASDLTTEVKQEIARLSKNLVDLQRNKWNGIWARIISNFLTTANLGRFDAIVGNPPWIDWKNLPQGYRERIKQLCIDRRLFSGDGITGGINLNVCALISNVAAQNWLKPTGTIGFLMPENLIFQQSYEGFRNFYLDDDKRLFFQRFVDWNKAGKPFAPVGHRFLGFFIGKSRRNYAQGVPVIQFEKKPNDKSKNILSLKNYIHCQRFSDIEHIFERTELVALTTGASTAFSYANDMDEGRKFALLVGACPYLGREGVEIFPQELFLLTVDKTKKIRKGCAYVSNYQSDRSKHKIAAGNFLIETDLLYPLVKGTDIERFHIEPSQYVVPFPYDDNARAPIESERLTKLAPNLMAYFSANRSTFEDQTNYNDKIIGEKHKNEFYALARVGKYSYGNHFVAFRDNTKWQAAVVSTLPVPWSKEGKRPVFQNHAVSISQRADGEFITNDEAHYICAIFNAPLVSQFILNSSDSRTFKIRPPVKVPPYDPENKKHQKLVALSKQAHIDYADPKLMARHDKDLDRAYLDLLKASAVQK
ncbi:N-6 DNA methylase [Pseudoxanthomonas sp.]|uniref:Eco57I restriction-modification methylase domain-containing protein n=1 Tax=Pseudoxanthomonas sp. TaxID=1871049 RepID=UPI002FDF38BB